MKFKPNEGPFEYDFIDPDTGYQYREASKSELITRINNYRQHNELPSIDMLGLVVENYMCQLPKNYGKCSPITNLSRSFWTVLKGGVSLVVNIWYGRFASVEVAEERAKQCASCPFNEYPDKTSLEEWQDSVAEGSVGDRKTSYQSKLGNCKVCSCVLKAKVFYDGDVSFSAQEIASFKEVNCWQLTLINKPK
jgi:hypothetical protein